jgi:hypothetical protein
VIRLRDTLALHDFMTDMSMMVSTWQTDDAANATSNSSSINNNNSSSTIISTIKNDVKGVINSSTKIKNNSNDIITNITTTFATTSIIRLFL